MKQTEAERVKAGDILTYHTENNNGSLMVSIKVRVRQVYRFAGGVRIDAVPLDENNELNITACDAPCTLFEK